MRPEYELLIHLVDTSGTAGSAELVRLLRGRVRWNLFLELAERSGTAPSLLFELRKRELTDLIPPGVLRRLHDAYEKTALHNSILLHDFRIAGETLTKQGKAWAPIGEIALVANSIYPDRGLRYVNKIELLVRSRDIESAFLILRQAGYRYLSKPASHLPALPIPPLINERGALLQLHDESTAGAGFDQWEREPLLHQLRRLNSQSKVISSGLLLLRGDQIHLNEAYSQIGGVPFPRLATRYELARSLRQMPRHEAQFSWFRLLFPNREDMRRRHGKDAAGMKLYVLYAARLFSIRHSIPAIRHAPAGR
jgi:hypothetical protein